MNLREIMNEKPAVAWGGIGAILLLAFGMIFFRGLGGADTSLQGGVQVTFADTGETVSVQRGRLEAELLDHVGDVSVETKLVNPKTGKPSGRIANESDWNATVKRINAMKAESRALTGPNRKQ